MYTLQKTFKSLEVYDIIFSAANIVNSIFDLDSFSIYDIRYGNQNIWEYSSIHKHELLKNAWTIAPKFDTLISHEFCKNILFHKFNKSLLLDFIYLSNLPNEEFTIKNLEKMIRYCVALRSANCSVYSAVMCSLLSNLLPKEYNKTLMIKGAHKDNHAVIFLNIQQNVFVIDLWAKSILKNKFGLICSSDEYIKKSSEIGIMKHFDLFSLHRLTEYSRTLDVNIFLKKIKHLL